ncbi:response regulator transcription factor [Ensifer sp. NPDC090286]|uniref:response regulator transcription factor n=1 Tax=unclassified Ensifer TaxID=2633371 RepID=UPI0005B8F96A|nr:MULTISPECIES: response regulator transcription factor [unclassified Ensifer]MBD9649742.1 response regulator transcription factor [Ensifer sp. ENS09]QRY70371.1 response regulator transcription factor [Ensifer sp. PDNC004]
MRILLIEDTPDIAFAISMRLEKEGYEVTTAFDGAEGERLALNASHDLVILDINLPKRDGFAILSAMRQGGLTRPVIVITARNQVADKVDLLELGADDYLVKPFDLHELVARIRAVSRRHLGAAQSVLRLGSISIDLSARAVMLEGRPLDLGRREFDVLEALATRAGTTVNKEQLVVKLFGYEDTGTPNAVELLVSRVRRKLEDCDIEIVTHRGVGYMLRQRTGSGASGAV